MKQKRQWEESRQAYFLKQQELKQQQLINNSNVNGIESINQLEEQSNQNTQILNSPSVIYQTSRQEDKLLGDISMQSAQPSGFQLQTQRVETTKRDYEIENIENLIKEKEQKEEDISFSQEIGKQNQQQPNLESRVKSHQRLSDLSYELSQKDQSYFQGVDASQINIRDKTSLMMMQNFSYK